MKKSLIILFFLSLIVFNKAHAEYRVFQFSVKAKNPFSMDQKTHLVTSTLDPQSYKAYHGGGDMFTIDLLRTWMCRGNTSHQEVCSPPLLKTDTITGVN